MLKRIIKTRKTRIFFFTVLSALLIALVLHAALWLWTANLIRSEIKLLYIDAAEAGYSVDGPFPVIGGYPLTHKVSFSGSVSDGTYTLEIPYIQAQGLFLPGRNASITMDSGLALRGPGLDPEIWSLSYLHINGRIPQTLPQSATVEDLKLWRDQEKALHLHDIQLKKRELSLTGNARVTLDQALQPAGEIHADIAGDYVDFLSFLKKKDVLETREALMIGAVLSGMVTDGRIVADITLENRTLLLGPVQLAELPIIRWPWRNAPARPR